MAMTAKDFDAIALEFGLVLKEINLDSIEYSKMKRRHTVDAMVMRFCRIAKISNSKFDRDKFVEFIKDVETGKRDIQGRKAK